MNQKTLSTMAAQVKQILREYVPEQDIDARVTLCVDSDDRYLRFSVKIPGGVLREPESAQENGGGKIA